MEDAANDLTNGEHPFLLDTSCGAVELACMGTGPTVLSLHGGMGGYDQALILSKTVGPPGYRYLAPSRPGYLNTPLSRGGSPEEQADLYAALLDALGVEKTAVLAISGGGPSAIHFALRHRSRCACLVLISTPAGKVDNRLPWSFHVMKALLRVPGVAASIERRISKNPQAAARRTMTNPALFERTMRDHEAWELMKALQKSSTARMIERFVGTENDVATTRQRDYPLNQIDVPTLVVQGSADPYVALLANGRRFARDVPGARLVVLQDGEHAAIFSHRAEAKTQVSRFLNEHVGAKLSLEPAQALVSA